MTGKYCTTLLPMSSSWSPLKVGGCVFFHTKGAVNVMLPANSNPLVRTIWHSRKLMRQEMHVAIYILTSIIRSDSTETILTL